MRVELFKQAFKINQSAHQAHLVYRVYVPENVSEIVVHFQYGPILETEKETIRKAVVREGLPESVIGEDTTVRNLLTVSINDPESFRGAHHNFNEDQTLIISDERATEGFIAGPIHEGYWEFIISCHGVFSEEVTGSLHVFAMTEFDFNKVEETIPFKELGIQQIVKDRERKTAVEPMSVKRTELHSHTVHSDAPQTTEELISQAEKEEIDYLAITDHNTISALLEAEQNKNFQRQVQILNGIEYTTFFGHFLVHGERDKIIFDWTKLSKKTLSHYLEKLQQDDVYITIAHPFDGGNPFCTGCRWEYVLENLKFVDAIEVWNGTNPQKSLSNEDAFHQWTRVLKQGYEIAASSGRDWHRLYPGEEIAYTYLLISQNETEDEILNSLKLGRTYISIRPQIDFKVNEIHILGDRVEDTTGELKLSITLDQLKGGDLLRIYSQDGLVFEEVFTGERQWQKEVLLRNNGYSLLRIEVLNEQLERVAFTNPIYIY
ncbi:CehA/McbA family metallohydrolase [Niallia sp. Krafla_26]|uniref:CehA/McbA family metallohydrolase n=1 Tax=Niallia sp. Krafla_26 TaxID=3064703 RepID=UPI003D17B13C